MRINRFEDIEGWQLARKLTQRIYALLFRWRMTDRRYFDQISAASVSVMNNIAEGFGSQSNREFIRFLIYSRRSCSEIQSCLYVALDQRYLTTEQFQELYDLAGRARRAVDGFLGYLRQINRTPRKPTKPT